MAKRYTAHVQTRRAVVTEFDGRWLVTIRERQRDGSFSDKSVQFYHSAASAEQAAAQVNGQQHTGKKW